MKDIIHKVAQEHDAELIEMEVMPDHVPLHRPHNGSAKTRTGRGSAANPVLHTAL